jgi:hypothetical protein
MSLAFQKVFSCNNYNVVVGMLFKEISCYEDTSPSSPLRLAAWSFGLIGYSARSFLCNGIAKGFDLGITGTSLRSAKVQVKSSELLQKKVLREVELGRIMGPFQEPPVNGFHLLPLALIEKKEQGKFRLIHNLSAPRGFSVNAAIDDTLKSVSYCKVSDVVRYLTRHGLQSEYYLAKFDIQDAFRMVPVHKSCWKYLGMSVGGAYFVDTRLPMGCGTSCAIFQAISSALCWMMEQRCPGVRVFGYLDDFLLVSEGLFAANNHMSQFALLCEELGVPIAHNKTQGPCASLVFLGIGIDAAHRYLYLDEDRVHKTLSQLDEALRKRSFKRYEWESLLGILNFLCNVVVPGRVYMSRLSRKLAGGKFWVHMDASTREDLFSWRSFVANRMCRPFPMITPGCKKWHLYTDAAASIGYGALLDRKWFCGAWSDPWWSRQNIMLLELYPIWAGLQLWASVFQDCQVVLHTDNEALVSVLAKGSSKLHYANAMLRDICLLSMRMNVTLLPEHVPGRDNILADLLSCLQVQKFLSLGHGQVDVQSISLTEGLVPMSCKRMLRSF